MTSTMRSAIGRHIVFGLTVFVVGLAGVFVGTRLRAVRSSAIGPQAVGAAPAPAVFEVGDRLPDVLVSDADGESSSVRDRLAGHSGTVVFLDPECGPCTELGAAWQALIDGGEVSAGTLLGVTYAGPETAREHRDENGFTFEVVSDVARRFLSEYDVRRFPYQLKVDEAGTITATSLDSRTPLR